MGGNSENTAKNIPKLSAAQVDMIKTLRMPDASVMIGRFANYDALCDGKYSFKINGRTFNALVKNQIIEFKRETLNHNIYGLTELGRTITLPE
jgi:hypothetical protein